MAIDLRLNKNDIKQIIDSISEDVGMSAVANYLDAKLITVEDADLQPIIKAISEPDIARYIAKAILLGYIFYES